MDMDSKTDLGAAEKDILQKIFDEIRLLRDEISFLLPQDDLDDYANGSRVRGSYEGAIKKYPPLAL